MAVGRRQYPFDLIEPKWQRHWDQQQTFRAWNPGETVPADHPFAQRHANARPEAAPKYYILDMFPYPSGAGLHVGHPEGYTATDILSRYRRALGYNVLHPMGWDAFGLPAEQYAIKTGQHPRKTTEENIATFKRQLKSFGFSYDWTREVNTTDPEYFKWTQWIFLKLYNSWFNPQTNRAEPIENLAYPAGLQIRGSAGVPPASSKGVSPQDLESKRRAYRDSKRLAFVTEAPVWWCEQLGTVLANEEVVDGKSEVGGFPVVRKPMRQWMLRITAYAERLLADLDTIEWTDSLKEMQRNWIGRSEGAEVDFQVEGHNTKIRVFTTRPDTLFGATYMVLAPEHKLVERIVPSDWPEETPYYWKGQIHHKGSPFDNLIREEKQVWHGLHAPPKGLTKEEAGEKAKQLNLEFVSLASWDKDKFEKVIPFHFALKYRAIPIEVTPDSVTIATDGPEDIQNHDALAMALGKRVEVKIATTEDLDTAHNTLRLGQNMIGGREISFAAPPKAVGEYRAYAGSKSDLERTELAKDKTGVFTGAFAINPVNGEKIPIWIADYVLATYGTGAIMAVPGHDTRDFEFATKFNLPVIQVVQPPTGKDWQGYVDDGIAVNSGSPEISLNGLPTPQAKEKITAWLESKSLGHKTINYKLRDWLFSRQRYWGEPFPIIWKTGADGQPYHEALPETALPLLPPSLEDYKPTPDGQPPLARAKEWLNLPDGSTRETNTMPQWAGSCWYYLRYLDAKNATTFCSPSAERYWLGAKDGSKLQVASCKLDEPSLQTATCKLQPATPGVDLYVGGTEHAVLHLLYARFWHKVLFDLGHVSTPEPFFKLVNQGLILGEDGQKMSKSRGNVINPDDILVEYGADAFRLYEMFMGPLEMVKPWNTKGVEGVYRFLGRVWRLFVDEDSETEFEQSLTTEPQRGAELLKRVKTHSGIKNAEPTASQLKTLHACIKKVTEDLDGLRFNTAISALMVFTNEAMTWETRPISILSNFLILLQPFAPHLAEELWQKLSTLDPRPSTLPLAYAPWPKFNPALLVEDTLEIAVQVNGKLRDVIKVPAAATQTELEAAAKAAEKAQPFLAGKTIKKVIVVPKKLVNLIAA